MANILYAKIGLKLPKKMWGGGQSGKSWSLGHDDDVRFLINVSYNNPDDNFYIIGASSFDEIEPSIKKELFPHENVFNAYNFTKYNAENRISEDIYKPHPDNGFTKPDLFGDSIVKWKNWDTENVRYRIPLEYLNDNNITVDYGIIAMSNIMQRNVYQKTETRKGDWAKPLAVSKNYAAPVIHTLNETGVKWVALVDDPRCMHGAFDLFNNPEIVLSQINGTMPTSNIESYEKRDTVVKGEVDIKYAYVESTVVMDEKVNYVDELWSNREILISVALNGGSNDEEKDSVLVKEVDSRYGMLEEWLLNPFPDVKVYGKWGEGIMTDDKDENGEQQRFMGSVDRDKLHSVMSEWKHSFCIPIKSSWSTTKYLELLKSGVSPFLHPNYDTGKNTKISDFYRVENSEEFRDKLELNDDIHIKELNSAIDSCLADEFTSGQYLNDIVYKYLGIDRNIKNVNRELWEVKPTGI